MKSSMFSKLMVLALSGLFHVVASAAAGSTKAPESLHNQFIILNDFDETPGDSNMTVTISFANALGADTILPPVPFLVSDSVVYNFLSRSKQGTGSGNWLTVRWDIWDVYQIEGARFILFVPKDYKNTHQNIGLKLDSENLTPMASDPDALLAHITGAMKHFRRRMPFRNLLERVFRIKSEYGDVVDQPVWDIIMHGHGNLPDYGTNPLQSAKTAGTTFPEIQDMLKFFNKDLNVNMFFIETCSAGGRNMNLLQFDHLIGKDVLLDLNFMIIVGAVDDNVTWIDESSALKWKSFFDAAAAEKSLSNILTALQLGQRHAKSPHAHSNIPQVWIPGGYGFQTYQVDRRVKVLSNVLVSAHEDEGRLITIADSAIAVLVYPKQIEVPVEIGMHEPSPVPGELKLRKEAWPKFPTVFEILTDMNLWEYPPSDFDAPVLQDMITRNVNFKFLSAGIVKKNAFPKFISMTKSGNAFHHFKKIVLKPADRPLLPQQSGVMHFIRDAFIGADFERIIGNKTFQIDELEGANDISLLLELIRMKHGGEITDLEAVLRPFVNQRIILRNVSIRIGVNNILIGFTFNDISWAVFYDAIDARDPDKIGWDFFVRDYHMEEYMNNINNVIDSEKSNDRISEILKKKIAIIRRQDAAFPKSALR